MGECLFARRGAIHTAPIVFQSAFADNTWKEIILACQKNRVPATWMVGDQKSMTINGTKYQIDIIGKNHDDYADGSGKAPLTLQLHDCYGSSWGLNDSDDNKTSWESSEMRTTNMPLVLSKMPAEVRTAIKEVNKLTSAGNMSKTIKTTADKLFLLSEIEVFGKRTSSFAGEGTQYEYYKTQSRALKYQGDVARSWWTRSPISTNSISFCLVSATGEATVGFSGSFNHTAPAFCF